MIKDAFKENPKPKKKNLQSHLTWHKDENIWNKTKSEIVSIKIS